MIAISMYENEEKIMPRRTKTNPASALSDCKPPSARMRLAWAILSFLCLILMLWRAETANPYMKQGLQLCAQTVIPSLFPFMVVSELLVISGGGEVLGKLLEKPIKTLFGISGGGVCALLMGFVCGFPIGTKTAVSLCRRGQITQDELSRLICICNIPGPAFLINTVGVSLFGSRRLGMLLYAACLLASLITARLLRHTTASPVSASSSPPQAAPAGNGVACAITSAATSMLYVCAYVIFFGTLSGILGQLLYGAGIEQSQIALLSGLLELSGGITQATLIENRTLALWISALLCGWSGFSVHLQVLSLCDHAAAHRGVDMLRYLFCKMLQGIFSALLFGIALWLSPASWFEACRAPVTHTISENFSVDISLKITVALIFLFLLQLIRYILPRSDKGRNRMISRPD